MIKPMLQLMAASCLLGRVALGADAELPLSLSINPKSEGFDLRSDIVFVCQLKNEAESPVEIKVPYFGSDHWIVDGCYGALPIPAKGGTTSTVRLEPKGVLRFERALKTTKENQLRLCLVDGKPVRERTVIDHLWKFRNSGSRPAFDSPKEYRACLELNGLNLLGVAGTIRSNDSIIRIQ